ncbi:MAG TPA: family 10 glycosylhydrolase [Gemmatimonadaceae bacterium]|nr:family 10 glycosylhydrolase [Gemmatimonadaceae bacterium]
MSSSRMLSVLAAVLFAGCAPHPALTPMPADGPPPVVREFRGVWVAAVSNIDWPSRPGLPVDSQKVELIRLLDRTRELGLNVFIFHVRTAGDALYQSSLEPWSEYLTGEQGRAPEPFYDPLEFAVREAHARGLELHAWFNPYRARHPSSRSAFAANHISRTHPELVKKYGSFLWMDPGEDQVRKHTIEVMADVTRRYDVDGIHIDDYFYPYRERDSSGKEIDFPDSAVYARYRSAGGRLERSDWRRNNVDRLIAEMYEAVHRVKPLVKVSVSPIGSWRQNVTWQTRGFDAYESIYADARKWLMDGSLDYIVPQIYWPIARTDVSFPVMLDWWVKQNPKGRGIYAGLIPGRVADNGWLADEIIGQIYVTRGNSGATGHVHFSMRSLMPGGAFTRIPGNDTLASAVRDSLNRARVRTQARRDSMTAKMIRETYAVPALTPAMTWLDAVPPAAPSAVLTRTGNRIDVTVTPPRGELLSVWVVQSKWTNGGWRTEIVPITTQKWTVTAPAPDAGAPTDVWVSVVDRVGNQSTPVRVREPTGH